MTFQVHLQGVVVDDERAPIVGATVTVRPYATVPMPAPVVTATDSAGRYDVTFVGNLTATVQAERDGYERTLQYADVVVNAVTVTKNLRLRRVIRIMAGDSRSLVLAPDDPACGFDDEWICRTIRVTATRAGTLALDVTADDGNLRPALGIGSIAWPTIPPYPCCPRQSTQAVAGGDEVIANIMLPWTSLGGVVTLRSSLQ